MDGEEDVFSGVDGLALVGDSRKLCRPVEIAWLCGEIWIEARGEATEIPDVDYTSNGDKGMARKLVLNKLRIEGL
jgi:hypothetical protein